MPHRFFLSTSLLGLAALLVCLPACAESRPAISENSPAADSPAAKPAPDLRQVPLGDGFVVWESNRSGAWRLWQRGLDGGELRRLTPEEPGRDHCCAHVSPDGRRLAYLSFEPGQRERGRPFRRGELRLISAGGEPLAVLDPDVRVPSEHRAVVWIDASELLYIGGDGHTRRLNVETRQGRAITRRPHPNDGWLMNPSLTYATDGHPSFSPFDPKTGAIASRRVLGGCQPYFSRDGRWGFWAAGAGGPIHAVDLASREVTTILDKSDPRLPADRGYLYFPMLSPDGTLLAFAASPDQHDFNRSDYDVFVAEVDPRTLELAGSPVRVTADPATDRFPEVFRRPLALGRHRGEAPLTLRFAPRDDGGPWEWSFGDGTAARGAVGQHTYSRPGVYEVTARRGQLRLVGRVTVEPARPPRAEAVEITGERRLAVAFDEPVDASGARLTLASGGGVSGFSTDAGGRRLVVDLESPITRPDSLIVTGLSDRAQRPNTMARTTLAVEPPGWPSRTRGLALLWQNGEAANLVPDPSTGAYRTYTLHPRGNARLSWNWAMRPAGGSFVTEEEAWGHLAAALRRTNQLTLELTVTPAGRVEGRGDVVSFGGGPGSEYLMLYQEGGDLLLDLRAGKANPVRLFPLAADRPTHVVVTYRPGKLTVYRDGEKAFESDELTGDFFAWKRPRPLVFGSGGGGERPWRGSIEGVAFYDRLLPPEEARENHRRYRALIAERTPPETLVVEASLAARSKIPTLGEIAPYRRGLVVFEYRVERVASGNYAPKAIRVAHWAILGGETQPVTRRPVGERVRLTLQPYDANPQLAPLFVSDTLPERFDLPLYYDAGE